MRRYPLRQRWQWGYLYAVMAPSHKMSCGCKPLSTCFVASTVAVASSVQRSRATSTSLLNLCIVLVQSIGTQGVNQLEPSRRDEYTRNVSSLEGLTSLTAAVSRTSLVMLTEVADRLALPCT